MVERVTIASEPTGPEAPEATSAANPDNTTPPAQSSPERPSWLDPKFETPEDLAKAYQELSKKLGTALARENKQNTPPKVGQPNGDEQAARETVNKAGLDFESLSKEWGDSGTLSEDSYKKLADSGIPKDMVDAYIAGQQAVAERTIAEVHDSVGGEERFNDMMKWASTNLSVEERTTFNTAIDKASPSEMKILMQGLAAKFEAGVGRDPQRTVTGRSGNSAATAFRSNEEVIAAMSDPRYREDPAYRKQVESRLAVSNVL